eukprot:scaffold262413_cov61-Attheya_sp.AAC.5
MMLLVHRWMSCWMFSPHRLMDNTTVWFSRQKSAHRRRPGSLIAYEVGEVQMRMELVVRDMWQTPALLLRVRLF